MRVVSGGLRWAEGRAIGGGLHALVLGIAV
jgi:hypothetical protein